MARCWVSEASDAILMVWGEVLVGFLLFDSLIVDASMSTPILLVGVFVLCVVSFDCFGVVLW